MRWISLTLYVVAAGSAVPTVLGDPLPASLASTALIMQTFEAGTTVSAADAAAFSAAGGASTPSTEGGSTAAMAGGIAAGIAVVVAAALVAIAIVRNSKGVSSEQTSAVEPVPVHMDVRSPTAVPVHIPSTSQFSS